MPRALENREEVFETVRALYFQGLKTSAISEMTGVKQKTIRTWSTRYGWGVIASELNGEMKQAVVRSVRREIAKLSEELRLELADEVLEQANALRKKRIRSASELGNKNGVQGRAAVTKTIVESAEKVFGWDGQQTRTPLLRGDFPDEIDVHSETSVESPATPAPALPEHVNSEIGPETIRDGN